MASGGYAYASLPWPQVRFSALGCGNPVRSVCKRVRRVAGSTRSGTLATAQFFCCVVREHHLQRTNRDVRSLGRSRLGQAALKSAGRVERPVGAKSCAVAQL